MYGRERRTILRDDKVGIVEGGHSGIANFQRTFDAPKPATVGTGGGGLWHLKGPAHDPAEFLTCLGVMPALDEPLRSTLPPVFDGVEVLRSTWADMTFDPNAIY